MKKVLYDVDRLKRCSECIVVSFYSGHIKAKLSYPIVKL